MAGSLSDVFGRRWTIVCGQVFCIVGSVRLPSDSDNLTNVQKDRRRISQISRDDHRGIDVLRLRMWHRLRQLCWNIRVASQ